jgi:hypothetical protein
MTRIKLVNTDQSVFKKAISARLSSGDKSIPNSWPGTARFFFPGAFHPLGS